MNLQSIILKITLRTIALARHFSLKDISVYSQNNKQEIWIEYPCIIVANHVSELDIPVVAYCERYAKGKTLFTVPAREDIFLPHFLVKEFKPKGFMKLLLKIIDGTKIVPNLLKLVHAIPVKRPFRDNAKELMKEGKLREHIDQNWNIIAEGMLNGKNVFMFPEGTYTDDGYVNPPRKGIGFLKEKISNLKINFLSLSYDYLTFSKTDAHVFLGNLHDFPIHLNKESISKYIRDMIGSKIIAHHGNLFSFACFTNELKEGIPKENFLQKLFQWVEKLKSKSICLSKRFYEKNYINFFNSLVQKMISQDFLKINDKNIILNEKFREKPFERAQKFRKTNPLLFHKNQLRFHETILQETWNKI